MQDGEVVFVVKREDLFDGIATLHGFGREAIDGICERIRRLGFWKKRSLVENDPSLKQIIPYMVVTDGARIFLLRRKAKQSEARLRNLYSIGVGGHINPVDGGVQDPVLAGMNRELREELSISGEPRISPLGYLNDDSNPVGSVHFGLVFKVEAPADSVSVAEDEMMEGRFATLDDLAGHADAMETWSRLLLEFIRGNPGAVLDAAGTQRAGLRDAKRLK